MAIYDKNGNALHACYDKSGNALNTAYDKNGNVVYMSEPPEPDYDTYFYSVIWQNSFISSHGGTQAFTISDDTVFWFTSASNGSGNVCAMDFSTGETIIQSTNIVAGHANSAFFGERYADSDDYPLLYVGCASATPYIYVNRITACDSEEFASSLIKTLTFPEPYNYRFDACFEQDNLDVLITSTYAYEQDEYAGFNVVWWDMTNLTDNGNGTYSPAYIKSIVTENVYVSSRSSDGQQGVRQSMREHDGLVWITTGYNQVSGYIYAFDEATGELMHTINLETKTEVEGIEFLPDATAVGGYALYVGFQDGRMRKYNFRAK